MKDKAIIAEKLIELRKAKGFNLKEAAEAIGIEYQNYRKYETTSSPKIDTLIKIADFYGVTTDYLVGRKNKKSNKDIKITYSEKEKDDSFIIHQSQPKIKVVDYEVGELSDLEIMVIRKFRKISNEDKNDVAQYLDSKKDE